MGRDAREGKILFLTAMENSVTPVLEPMDSKNGELLRLVWISKYFPGVRALHNVHLEVRKGEVHALLGENGAGKSTLMKILSGAYARDAGEIVWEGQKIEIHNPAEAQRLGIGIIYQEFNLAPQLSIAENVWISREPLLVKPLHLIDWQEMYRKTKALLDELNLDLDPRRPVKSLGVAHQQMVEIAKDLSLDAKLLIMDEPTSALADAEILQLFGIIRKLKERGVSVVFISHHVEEVFEICDRGTILRDGEFIKTLDLKNSSKEELIQLMVGRALEQQYPKVASHRSGAAAIGGTEHQHGQPEPPAQRFRTAAAGGCKVESRRLCVTPAHPDAQHPPACPVLKWREPAESGPGQVAGEPVQDPDL
jgi:ribose transport system ATP-binding protein